MWFFLHTFNQLYVLSHVVQGLLRAAGKAANIQLDEHRLKWRDQTSLLMRREYAHGSTTPAHRTTGHLT
jgi:hypothetical protein